MKKIHKSKLNLLLKILARQATLYLPLEKDGIVNFAPWKEGACINFEVLTTVVPLKSLIFPQTETFLRFESDARSIQLLPVESTEKFIVFGARSCDLASFEILDRVFLEEPVDSNYLARRRHGTLISLACSEPGETCFCTTFGIDPCFAPGSDVMLQQRDEYFFWEAISAKGEALTRLLNDLLDDAAPGEREKKGAVVKRPAVGSPAAAVLQGRTLQEAGEALREQLHGEIWENISRRCLGCGICTYLCPTCHCFDIGDFERGSRGQRFRCWDSCMFAEFTLRTSGENPRPTQKERVRQRFMHKLLYFPSRYGLYACVGCGRCVNKCPVHLDIIEVMRDFTV